MNEEMNEQNGKKTASPKLSNVVLLVLVVHVVLIAGVVVYSLLKGNISGKDHADMIAGPEDSGEVATVAASGSHPAIETNADEANVSTVAPVTADAAVTATSAGTASPMPGVQDPIWNSTVSNQPAAVPAQAQVTAGADATYTVQKGDSLYKIARQSGVTVAELKQINGLASDALKPGQTLNLPAKAVVPTAPVVTAGSQSAPAVAPAQNAAHAAVAGNTAVSFQSYKVAPGDTLWKIARQFNTKPDVIVKANNISDPSKLKVGMEIKVPAPVRETVQPAAQPQAVVPGVNIARLPQNRS